MLLFTAIANQQLQLADATEPGALCLYFPRVSWWVTGRRPRSGAGVGVIKAQQINSPDELVINTLGACHARERSETINKDEKC